MTAQRGRASDEVSFGDLLRWNGGGAARSVRPETREEHLAAMAASPLAEFGPCRCAKFCDGFGSSSAVAR